MRRSDKVIYILLFIFILIALLFSPLTSYLLKDLIISKLEKSLDMNIVLGRTELKFPSRLTVYNVKAVGKYGPTFVAENADLQLNISQLLRAKVVLNCNFQKVRLESELRDRLNSILTPFGVQAQEIYTFNDMKGVITIMRGVFAIGDLKAQGTDFKLSGNFLRTKNKETNYDIEFGINKQVVNITEKQGVPILIDEDGDGWYTIKLSIKGNPRNPSSIFFSTGGIKLQVKPDEQ